MTKNFLFFLILSVSSTLCLSVGAQEKPNGVDISGGQANEMTARKELQLHHIEVTKEGLVKALWNSDATVRTLAAFQLEMDGTREAIPDIVAAMDTEEDVYTRISLADSVGKFGEAKGISELKDICEKLDNPEIAKLQAAQALTGNFHDETCNPILHALGSDEPQAKWLALSLIPQFQFSTGDSKKLFKLVLNLLIDSDPTVRNAAGEALAEIGNQAAVPKLQAAIANEREADTRISLQGALKKLLERAGGSETNPKQ